MTKKKEPKVWCEGCGKGYASVHSLRTHAYKVKGACTWEPKPRSRRQGIGAKARYEQKRTKIRKEKREKKLADERS